MSVLRWYPFACADGAYNMAADDVLLEAAATHGFASLRFYGWTPATVSLGYFQAAEVLRLPGERRGVSPPVPTPLQELPFVRRPSGGKTLVHQHELTYALTLPPSFESGWMRRMHERVILPALNCLGFAGKIAVVQEDSGAGDEFLCFKQQTPGDLVCEGHKVVGSAQRKHRRALLQHGAILLAQSEFTPQLPGIKELTGVELAPLELQDEILRCFRSETGWEATVSSWTHEKESMVRNKVRLQYGTSEWNQRR